MSDAEAQVVPAEVLECLGAWSDPHSGKTLTELGALDVAAASDASNSSASEASASPAPSAVLTVKLPYPAQRYARELEQLLDQHLQSQGHLSLQAQHISLRIQSAVSAHTVQKGVSRIDGIKNIIAIASGKGGVGKSTTAVNLALALIAEGASVGMLDADIYGPSQPRMLNLSGKPDSPDGKSMAPKQNYGIATMSMGFLVDDDSPTIWRGPMVTQALEQLLFLTQWGELDYLIVDLPPGTGDTQLTLAQKVPLSGAVIVTTPQDIALADARKGLRMFESVDVPILGIVENMSFHRCPDCGREERFFGRDGGRNLATEASVRLLGELPLDVSICEQADSGKPSVVAEPDGEIATLYRRIARNTTAQLSLHGKDYKTQFPNIVIQST